MMCPIEMRDLDFAAGGCGLSDGDCGDRGSAMANDTAIIRRSAPGQAKRGSLKFARYFFFSRPPHSPMPIPVLTVHGAADAKANSCGCSLRGTTNERLHLQLVRGSLRMGRPQTRHDVELDRPLEILYHLAGDHDPVDYCGDRPVEKSHRAATSVICDARSLHHRRRPHAHDSPSASQPRRLGVGAIDVSAS